MIIYFLCARDRIESMDKRGKFHKLNTADKIEESTSLRAKM